MIIRLFHTVDAAPFSEIHIPDELLPGGDGAALADAIALRWASRCEIQPDRPLPRDAEGGAR